MPTLNSHCGWAVIGLINSAGRALPVRFRSKMTGQAIVMVAIMMTILMGFTALVIDTGRIWMSRRALQNSVDAAALAGVQELPNDLSGAKSVACDYASVKNYVADMFDSGCGGKANVIISNATEGGTTVVNGKLTVTTKKDILPTFGAVLGWPTITIGAKATAIIGSIHESCAFPIFQTPSMIDGKIVDGKPDPYTITKLHLAPDAAQAGNFLTVDVGSGIGPNGVLGGMVSNTCTEPLGDTAFTQTGRGTQPILNGFEWRIACAADPSSRPSNTPECPPGPSACPSPDIQDYRVLNPDGTRGDLDPNLTRDNCTRLVIIPIFPDQPYGGHTEAKILGFAVFYIAGVCSDNQGCTGTPVGDTLTAEAWGYYVQTLAASDDIQTYDQFGTKVPILVD